MLARVRGGKRQQRGTCWGKNHVEGGRGLGFPERRKGGHGIMGKVLSCPRKRLVLRRATRAAQKTARGVRKQKDNRIWLRN